MEIHENIFNALAAAQGEFGEIIKDKTATVRTRSGAEYDYNYADLGSVLNATRPQLSKHGLSISWVFRNGQDRGTGFVITQLLHATGKLESELPLFYDPTAQSVMQSLGSAITYAKRYGLCGLIGVVAEDDDDGAGAGTPPKQEPRREPQQRQQKPAKAETKAADKSQPATNGEKKPLIEQIKDRIQAAACPEALVEIMAKSVENPKWSDKQQFLEEIFNLCAEENRARAASGANYYNAGQQQAWDDETRKSVFAELTRIMDGRNQQPAETPAEPVDWPTRIAAVKKSEELFALISAAADDGDLTADPDAFRAVCGLLSAKLDQHATEWGDGVTNISRHHLAQRITAVELYRQHKEAMNNG